jgi:hypothetical protein
MDIIPGTLFLGVGLGLALPLTANIVLSSVHPHEHSDAAGIMSTSANMGSSMGTAIIGVVLLLGILNGLYAAVDQNFPNEFSKIKLTSNL